MGLFGKSFEEEVEAALAELRAKHGVPTLAATIEGKIVTLTGEAPSMEVKGALMQEFNARVKTENTLNMIRLPRPAAPAAPAPAPAPEAPAPHAEDETWHDVVRGDTLGAIAKKHYGNAGKYMKIFEANRDILDDPNLIKVGQRLRIPK